MKKIHLLLCIVLACSAFTCNSGNTTSETPAGDSAPAMASNDKDEVLTVFRHVDRTEAVSYQVADSELDPREFPNGFYSFTKCHLMWPKTIYGKTSRKLEQALIDALSNTEGKFKTVEDALNYVMQPLNNIPFERNQIKNVKTIKAIPEDAGMNQAYFNVNLFPQSIDADICVFRFEKEDYMGGAHGMNWNRYVNYDVKGDKVIQLTDLVTDTVKLRQVITEALFDKEDVRSIADLNEAGYIIDTNEAYAPITTDFYLEGFDIHFVYAPYAIASYAMGSVDVVIYPFQLDKAGIMTEYYNNLISRYTR